MAKKFEPRTYDVPADQLYDALKRAMASLKYKINGEDPATKTITFNTGISIWSWGGQDMAVQVTAVGESQSTLDVGGELAVKIQATSWGEKNRIAKKLFAQVEEIVGAPVGE